MKWADKALRVFERDTFFSGGSVWHAWCIRFFAQILIRVTNGRCQRWSAISLLEGPSKVMFSALFSSTSPWNMHWTGGSNASVIMGGILELQCG